MTTLDYQSPETAWQQRSKRERWLGWAIFLGMSWTWCIGMFLPVLLVRDYGPWAWLAFAVPNVLGAAAMGWVLTGSTSEAITLKHGLAITAFSWVTASFQAFFVFWIFDSVFQPHLRWIALCAAAVFAIASRIHIRLAVAASVIALAVSAFAISQSSADSVMPEILLAMEAPPPLQVFWLMPVMVFGFLFCPYLDATFHAARQQTSDSESRVGFSFGFGLFFCAMIVFSLAYARYVPTALGHASRYIQFIALHWCAQLALTLGFHWHFGASTRVVHWDADWVRMLGSIAAGVLAWRVSGCFGDRSTEGGERVYRLFMAFYGLVFPAYVWLCMIPGRGRIAPDRRQWIVFTIAVLVAAPMFWMGFILGRMYWLLPGLGVVLLARVLIPRKVAVT